jgi:hypothetical protein
MTSPEKKSGIPSPIGPDPGFFPPRVAWAKEMGWLNVRDQWGQWHCIAARDAPRNWVKLAMQAKGRQ